MCGVKRHSQCSAGAADAVKFGECKKTLLTQKKRMNYAYLHLCHLAEKRGKKREKERADRGDGETNINSVNDV